MYIKTKMWPSLADLNYISQFHEAPFHGNLEFMFGTLVSHGCIRIQKNFIGSMLHLNETTRKHFCFLFFFKYLFINKIVKPRWICCCPNLFSFHQKRIQEAFVPKKRLAKEYEQLAIWFGDAYMGPEQNTLQNLLPATSSATLESENSRTRHICDSEWELL